jgi:hypothetical protein
MGGKLPSSPTPPYLSRVAQLSESPIADTIVPAFIPQCVSFQPHPRLGRRHGRSARQPKGSASESTTGECVHKAWNGVRGPTKSISVFRVYISPKITALGPVHDKARRLLSRFVGIVFLSKQPRVGANETSG